MKTLLKNIHKIIPLRKISNIFKANKTQFLANTNEIKKIMRKTIKQQVSVILGFTMNHGGQNQIHHASAY